MKADTLLKKTTATLGATMFALALGACSTHRAVDTTAQTTGEIRTEQNANNATSGGETLGTVAAPANAQGVSTPSTPAVISGPAAVDKSGNAYTSSSVGAAGNGSGTGLNTNVNVRAPRDTGSSSVVVTQSPATTVETVPAPVVVETTPAPAPVVVETTPAPAPVVIETPAPAPVVVETPAPAPMPAPVVTETQTTTTETTTVPMSSSSTTTTTKHRRMRKD
jgi:hypothetical protein